MTGTRNWVFGTRRWEAVITSKLHLILIPIALLLLISLIVIANSLNDEASLLEQELINVGYGWLADYSGEDLQPKIEVYEKDGIDVIADFGEISEDKMYKIYLSNLTREGGQDVFDLLIKGGRI